MAATDQAGWSAVLGWPYDGRRRGRLLVGSVVEHGARFRLHVHVIPGMAELERSLAFRDALIEDGELRVAYETEKLRILATGTTDSLRYTHAKTEFVERAMRRLGRAVP